MSKLLPSILIGAISAAAFAATVQLPQPSTKSETNLQSYLKYQSESKIGFTCKSGKKEFVCTSRNQKVIETDDENITTVTSFKNAELHFSSAVAPVLAKEKFAKTLKEMKEIELEREKLIAMRNNDAAEELSSPLQDELDRTLFGNLDLIRIKDLKVDISQPKTAISFDELLYENYMKNTAKDAAFSERIFGNIRFSYKNAVIDSNDSDSFYKTLPQALEEWLETDNEKRAKYVGEKLESLYSEHLSSPASGRVDIATKYLGNDALSVKIDAKNANRYGESELFKFSGDIHNISTIFESVSKTPASGTPDFLFRSMDSTTTSNASGYRALLKKDKLFAKYIGEYDELIRANFDLKMKKYAQNTVLSGWFKQAKKAFSKLLKGEAGTLEVSVKNRNGATAMQIFGMVMGQLMVMSQQQNSGADQEKIIMDTAAQNLDVHIEAR